MPCGRHRTDACGARYLPRSSAGGKRSWCHRYRRICLSTACARKSRSAPTRSNMHGLIRRKPTHNLNAGIHTSGLPLAGFRVNVIRQLRQIRTPCRRERMEPLSTHAMSVSPHPARAHSTGPTSNGSGMARGEVRMCHPRSLNHSVSRVHRYVHAFVGCGVSTRHCLKCELFLQDVCTK